MPVENERKFVLKPPFDNLEKKISEAAEEIITIEQGYLHVAKKLSVRIRSKKFNRRHDNQEYFMTVKRTVNGETIEIENEINREDFDSLWSVTSGKLKKTRYMIQDWEIDFFKNNSTYFAQAEIELPPKVDYPDKILDIIKNDILYEVKKGDNRFANTKLGDIRYSTKMLKLLLEKK